jgi:hypothetical protein
MKSPMIGRTSRVAALALLAASASSASAPAEPGAPPSSPLEPAGDYVFVLGTDFGVSGTTGTIEADAPWSGTTLSTTVCSDAVARCFGGLVYVVNRLGCDNVQVLDPSSGFATVLEFSTGPGSNPQDIAFVTGERAYVSRYETTWLYEVNPATGAVTDSIDLALFADADGLPEMGRMAVVGPLLFVALERVDRDFFYTPVAPGQVAVVDTRTNALVDADPDAAGVQPVVLSGTNPRSEIQVDTDTGRLFLGAAGSLGAPDGGIEVVDAVGLRSLGFLATEAQLGGDVSDLAFGAGDTAFAVVSDASFNTSCVCFDTTTGDKTGTLYATSGFNVADVEVHRASAQLFLCDRTFANPGVRVFDTSTCGQLTTGPISVGLPPFDLVVKGETSTPAGDVPQDRLRVTHRPNPFNPTVRIELRLPEAGYLDVEIFDAAGRRVRGLFHGYREAGSFALTWDGRDDESRQVGSGTYFYLVRTVRERSTGKMTLAR